MRAMITAFGCFATRAKSRGVRVSPSPNMMMPRATGNPMVVNADPIRSVWRMGGACGMARNGGRRRWCALVASGAISRRAGAVDDAALSR